MSDTKDDIMVVMIWGQPSCISPRSVGKPAGRLRKGKKAHNRAVTKNIPLYGRQAKLANRFSKLQAHTFAYYEARSVMCEAIVDGIHPPYNE